MTLNPVLDDVPQRGNQTCSSKLAGWRLLSVNESFEFGQQLQCRVIRLTFEGSVGISAPCDSLNGQLAKRSHICGDPLDSFRLLQRAVQDIDELVHDLQSHHWIASGQTGFLIASMKKAAYTLRF
jgi:hypothetical protein